jgi:hypothetical protein
VTVIRSVVGCPFLAHCRLELGLAVLDHPGRGDHEPRRTTPWGTNSQAGLILHYHCDSAHGLFAMVMSRHPRVGVLPYFFSSHLMESENVTPSKMKQICRVEMGSSFCFNVLLLFINIIEITDEPPYQVSLPMLI